MVKKIVKEPTKVKRLYFSKEFGSDSVQPRTILVDDISHFRDAFYLFFNGPLAYNSNMIRSNTLLQGKLHFGTSKTKKNQA